MSCTLSPPIRTYCPVVQPIERDPHTRIAIRWGETTNSPIQMDANEPSTQLFGALAHTLQAKHHPGSAAALSHAEPINPVICKHGHAVLSLQSSSTPSLLMLM